MVGAAEGAGEGDGIAGSVARSAGAGDGAAGGLASCAIAVAALIARAAAYRLPRAAWISSIVSLFVFSGEDQDKKRQACFAHRLEFHAHTSPHALSERSRACRTNAFFRLGFLRHLGFVSYIRDVHRTCMWERPRRHSAARHLRRTTNDASAEPAEKGCVDRGSGRARLFDALHLRISQLNRAAENASKAGTIWSYGHFIVHPHIFDRCFDVRCVGMARLGRARLTPSGWSHAEAQAHATAARNGRLTEAAQPICREPGSDFSVHPT